MNIETFATTAFLTLFVIVDPIGLSSLFLSVTERLSPQRRRSTALRAVLIAGGILIVFLFGGGPLFEYLGVSVDALRIAGGLLLFKLAFDMVLARRERQTDAEEEESHHRDDVAVFPLGIPLIAGPGAFATILVLEVAADGRVSYIATLIGALLAVLVIVYLGFRLAIPIQRVLGETGIAVVTRVLGIILAALSVQLVIDGVVSVAAGV
ncbi:MAG: MarC family protein [Acidimicrobiia bacterium]|nr:MarC family protein [Acidimicrobiia bacterium]